MVTDTKEGMSQMFDTMAETTRASMEAGKRIQESWFEAVGGTSKETGGFESVLTQGEKFTREFFPYLGKNMHTMVEACNSSFQSGMEWFRTAGDATMKACDADPYRRSRDLWDSAFNAVKSNFNAMNKASRRVMENWAGFCQATCAESLGAKPTTKTSK